MERFTMCLLGYSWYSGAAVLAKEVITRKILGREHFDSSVSLLLATHSGHRQSVEFLLENGANVTGDVIYIATHTNVDILKRLLQQPRTNVNDRGNAINGDYPLIVASQKGFIEAVNCMIEFKADTGVQNTAGMTALHVAILYNKREIMKSLVEAGAPLNIKGGKLKTPMHLAVDFGDEQVVQYLLGKGASASLRMKDQRGHYPIHIAAIDGCIRIVRDLFNADKTQENLRISSDESISSYEGMLLFHVAVCKKTPDLLDTMIALKADPYVQDYDGQTPLAFAIMQKQEGFVRKLIDYEKCDERKPQKTGYTPLHAAIHENRIYLAIELAEFSDVNTQDKYGKTPLHVACEKANIEVISMLLRKYDADPRIVTKSGDTVYHILRRCKKKLSENGEDYTKQAEYMIAEFDSEFAHQLPKL